MRRFLQYLHAIRRSSGTVSLYGAALRRAGTAFDLSAPSFETIRRWVGRRRKTVSQGTINCDLSALRAFYRWAFTFEYLHIDYSALVPAQRRGPRRLVRTLSEHQIGALLAAPALATPLGYRDHVLMRLAYETGLRASELAALSLGSISEDQLVLVQDGKGRVDRLVPFSDEMAGLLASWEAVRRQLRPGKRSALFVTSRGKAFASGRTVWEITSQHARRVLGLACGYEVLQATATRKPWSGHYPHLLRSSMASHMLANGCDLRAVQELLGHRQLDTTARYLAVDLDQLRAGIALLPR